MSAGVEKLMAPAVAVVGAAAPATDIQVRERPFVPVEIGLDFPAAKLARVPRRDDPIRVTAGGLTAEGHVRAVQRVRTATTDTVSVVAVCRSAPWRPRAVCFRQKKRSFCLRALLAETPLAAKAAPVGDEQRAWLSVLADTPWYAAARLALLGGQLLLNSAAGAVLVRPDRPGAATKLPGSAFFSVDELALSGLTLLAGDPKAWGNVLTKSWAPSGHGAGAAVLRLGEAVSEAELGAAGAAVRAAELLGRFEAHGGPELLGVGIGDWVAHPDGSNHLVTGRSLTWTRAAGWRVELTGGYPWSVVTDPPPPAQEPAEVTGFDPDTGRLTVRLPRHGGTVIGVFPHAARGGADSYRLVIPAVGERGLVGFAHSHDHGLYLGAAAPAGVLTRADFDAAVELARTPGSSARLLNDGTAEFTWKSFKVVCRAAMEHVASLFKFNKG